MSETIIPAPAAKADRPIRFTDVLLAIAATLGGTFVIGGLLGAMIGVIWALLKWPGTLKDALENNFTVVVGLTTLISAVILVLLLMIATRFTRRPIRYFFPPVSAAVVVNAALSAVAVILFGVAVEAALKYGWHISLNVAKSEQAMTPKSWEQLGIVMVCFVAFVPFYEEYLFRGYIFGWLKRVTPVWIAVILSAALFSAMHGLFLSRGGISGWVGTGEIFVLGCVMAAWVAKTGSLWPSYIVHIVNNALAFTLAFLLPNLP